MSSWIRAGSGVRCLGACTGGRPRLELAVNGGGFGRVTGGRLALAADGSGLRTEAVLGSADSWGRSGSAKLDGTSCDDRELDVTSEEEEELDRTSGDLGGSLELGRAGGAVGEVCGGSQHGMSWGGAAHSSWSGMTRLRNYLDFQIRTVKKWHKIDQLDQGIGTGGKITAYSLIIQPQIETRT